MRNQRTQAEIESKIAEFIEVTTLGRIKSAEVQASQSLLGDLGLDSLDYATTMLSCEEWLGAKVREGAVDWRTVRTVADLASLLFRSQCG